MPKKDKVSVDIKQDVGARFCQFRKTISKTQQELAEELKVYQSTITNFELGKTFPNLNYLHYFHLHYGLDLNWLISGKGEQVVLEYHIKPNSSICSDFFPGYKPNLVKKHSELLLLMEIPIVEQVIAAKLEELKVILKDQIEAFYLEKKKAAEEYQKQGSTNGENK